LFEIFTDGKCIIINQGRRRLGRFAETTLFLVLPNCFRNSTKETAAPNQNIAVVLQMHLFLLGRFAETTLFLVLPHIFQKFQQHQTPAPVEETAAPNHNIAVGPQMYLFRLGRFAETTLFLVLPTFFRNSGTRRSTKVNFSEINSVN